MEKTSGSGPRAGGYKTIVYVICMVAALGGLLFGLDQGFIANSLETLTKHYQFGVQGGEKYSAILATGGIVGALLSGIFARFLGRKKLLYVGAVTMLVTMVAAGLAFQVVGNVSDPSLISGTPKMILLAAVIVYIFGFAVSWGPVVWLVCSEVFPLEGREVGMTITTMVNWTFAGLVMANALSFMGAHGNASIFYVFAGFCVLAIAFVALFVPETRQITLEELEFNLKKGIRLRDLGNRG